MFVRLLGNSIRRRKARKLLAVLAVWIGLTLVLALLTLSLDVGDRLNRELQAFGANIRVEPLGASLAMEVGGHRVARGLSDGSLAEADVEGLKDIFWANQLTAVAPRLTGRARLAGREVEVVGTWFGHAVPVRGAHPFVTGARETYPHWRVSGRWPAEAPRDGLPGCLVGAKLADELGLAVGSRVALATGSGTRPLRVDGIVVTGDGDDHAILAPLPAVQGLLGAPGRVTRVDVAAMTTPENELARRYREDPEALTMEEYDRWFCTPYPGSVAAGIQEAIEGSSARVVRRVSETQGTVLSRIEGLVLWLAGFAVVACGLGVSGVLSASILERRGEVALLQAVGAQRSGVAALFLLESGLLGLVGGALAAGTGVLLGGWLVQAVFGTAATPHAMLMGLAPLLGALLACGATLRPVWRALGESTARTLAGG